MQRHVPVVAVLLGAQFALDAQSYTTSPPGYVAKSVLWHGQTRHSIGETAKRWMFLDGDLRNQPMRMREIAARQPTHGLASQYSYYFFSQVTISLSHTDYTRASSTFSLNPTSTPTRVFKSAFSFPGGQNGGGKARPWNIRFPLTSLWQYSGKQDLCIDMAFVGGSSSGRYELESCGWESVFQFGRTFGGTTCNSAGCYDSNYSYSGGCWRPGTIVAAATTLQPTRTRARPEIEFYFGTRNLTVGSIARLVGVAGNTSGIPFPGVSCNRLYVDTTRPHLLFFENKENWSRTIPFHPNLKGLVLWYQAGWLDRGVFKLTNAADNVILDVPYVPKKRVVEGSSASATSGVVYGALDTYRMYVRYPLFRYCY